MNRSVLLSVRPRFARGLLGGTKTAEVRRRFPNVPDRARIAIYSSSPDKAIIGTMRVRRVVRMSAAEIWRDYADAIAIDEVELSDYLRDAPDCCVVELDAAEVWERPVNLDVLRQVLNIEPPQSFRYLTARQFGRLELLGRPAVKANLPNVLRADTGSMTALA